jgi:hypothetical protein
MVTWLARTAAPSSAAGGTWPKLSPPSSRNAGAGCASAIRRTAI